MMRGVVKAVLRGGGPYDGQDGEVVLSGDSPPRTLAFPRQEPAYVYALDSRSKRTAVYQYAPHLRPGHPALVRADAEAVQEVARQRNVSVPALLASVRKARQSVQGANAPAEVLFREAERRGVSVEVLLAEHEQTLALSPEGVHL